MTGTLQTVASDAKAQVEWNPAAVSRWRLLGYENRDIADHRFRDDTVDAGEIGVGHTVTALYEVKLKPEAAGGELGVLRLRYRSKESGEVIELAEPLAASEVVRSWDEAPAALRLAATVAEFAELLKGSFWAKDGSFAALLREVQAVSAELPGRTDVAELVGMVGRAARLKG